MDRFSEKKSRIRRYLLRTSSLVVALNYILRRKNSTEYILLNFKVSKFSLEVVLWLFRSKMTSGDDND